ncbi:SusC/RagA family TonB-linked outer membrane protein [Polaribacter batillariae]|uniref:SusC/RagA family TonB-linked outer membrane protein n=1 Tax=Polaribacter batillariae TaxID=2808900 RepID=A0ABX7SX42_9FLAO|nr:SusC/RagA family TonB-linked outer membrane protein [Polaribacter batillariae]QTD37878.1 SusC/RagA family TonB-linked outer membrane protein [Polaribacter batillariae]
MKISLLFILFSIVQIFSNEGYSQKKITFHLQNVTIKQALNEIKNQTDYKFLYRESNVNLNKKISLEVVNEPTKVVLNKLFKNTEIVYEIVEKQIVLKKKTYSLDTKNSNQSKIIKGVVSDNTGVPLPGVSIQVKGTTKGTVTDFNGEYSISVDNENAILVFSYLGFKNKELEIKNKTQFNVTLEEDSESLDEVVIVSALGFEVKTDKLGSAVSSVKSEALTRSGETNLANSMQGKMAGVNITRSTGDPGAGSNIRIRGANTITGSTQPLIIVDGIPISNSNNSGGGSSNTGNGTSQQSRLNDINPNDIETLQVLKGASAAALWGSRASNGVVIITTKSGKKGFKISFKNTVAIDEVSQTQKLQSNYGQGQAGRYRSGTELQSWGDEIAARAGGMDNFITTGGYFIGDQTGKTYYPVANGTASNPHGGKNSKETFVDSNFNKVFGTGVLLEQSLSISGGDDKSTIFFSLGNTDHKGVIRNNDYKRHTINISSNRKFNDFIHLKLKGKYARVSANRIQQNSNTAGLLLGLYRTPADFDISDYTGTYIDANGAETIGRHRSYRNAIGQSNRPRYNNPLWTTNKQQAPNIVNRHIYSADLDLFPTEGLNIKLRGGIDTYNDNRSYLYPIGSSRTTTPPVSRLNGSLVIDDISETELNFDAIVKYDNKLSEKITSTFILGWNVNDRKFSRNTVYGDGFIANQDLFNLVNATTTGSENFKRHIKSYRTYSTANFGLFDQLYVDLSGTVELASTIDDAFFYPSASAAWQISNADFYPEDSFMNFAKVRLSWGKVGIQPRAYETRTYFEGDFGYSSGTAGSINSIEEGGGFRLDNQAGDPNLKPEIKTEIEGGLEMRFFNSSLSTSFTYYSNEVKDILLELQNIPSLGFDERYTNGATMTNRGFEFEFNAKLLRNNENWSFSPYGNFATNKNKVTNLAGGGIQFLTGFGIGDSVASEGYQMGAIFGGKLPRNADGSIVLDANGFPLGTPEYDIIGDPNPDWTGALGFNVAYKNVSLNVLVEHSQGGDFYDITRQINSRYGLSEETGNKVTIPTGGVVDIKGNFYAAGDVVRGNLYDFGAGPVLLEEQWYDGPGANSRGFSELWLQDATWTRLREVALTYNFGKTVLEKLNLSSASIGITGRNLILWTDVIGNDPDKNFAGVGNSRGLDYYTNPTTKSYLFNLNLTF